MNKFQMAIPLIVAVLLVNSNAEAVGVGAKLEAVTIKDMYFGFAVAGLISRHGYIDEKRLIEANEISNAMMKYRRYY